MRVVIGEDQALFREGLARLLTEAGFAVVGQACDATELLVEVGAHRPDVVVTDVRMPPDHTDDGLRAAQAIRARFAGTAVLVLSQYVVERAALELIGESPCGVGYLLKDRVSDVAVLVDALHRVVEGECVIDPTIVQRLMRPRATASALSRLTPREREVLTLMAEGRSNAAIAARLGMGDRTLEAHIRQVLVKLDLEPSPDDHRRVLAVLQYLQAT